MEDVKVSIGTINNLIKFALWTTYDKDFRKPSEWKALAYSKDGVVFKNPKIISPNEPFFNSIGNFLLLHRPTGEFFAIMQEEIAQTVMVVSKKYGLLKLGDVLWDKSPVLSLKIVDKELYVNNKKFSDLVKNFNEQK